MTSAQVVETSVNVISNSPSQDYTHPDDRTLLYGLINIALLATTRTPADQNNLDYKLQFHLRITNCA